ncbi:hypothetical protein [Azospirillum palustre]
MVESYGEHGYDVKPGAWKLPAVVTPDVIAEAGEHLAWTEGVLLADAATEAMRSWLLALGNASASSRTLTPDDVEMKVGVMLTLMDDYPAGVFTKATLKRAARRFRFFPGFEELAPFLDDEARDLRVKRDRLLAITKAQPTAPKAAPKEEAIAPATDEQKAAVREMLAKAGVPLADPAPVVTGSAAAGEVKRVPGSDRDREEPTDTREAVRRVMAETQNRRRIPNPWQRAASSNASTEGNANG